MKSTDSQLNSNGSLMSSSLWRLLRSSDNGKLLFLSVTVGVMTGIALWLFHEAIHLFEVVFRHSFAEDILHDLGPFGIVISLSLAGFIVGWIMNRFVDHEKYHGVTKIIESVALAGGRLRTGQLTPKFLASSLSLGAGASVGPEDPSVIIGSNLGSFIGQRVRLDEEQIRLLVSAGAASAISAAFNAPIAGVFFALEVILRGDLSTGSVGVVILAAVMTQGVTQGLDIATTGALGPMDFSLESVFEIPFFVPLGLLVAPFAVGFIRMTYWQNGLWARLTRLPAPLKTALGGALVGLVGMYLPEILGGGREVMEEVLHGDLTYTIWMLGALAVAKLVMTTVSLGAGFVGGTFAPSLFIGTMLGNAYGHVVTDIFGASAGDPRTYAIAGMAGLMAGVVRAPITAIMLVFELTNDYRFILPIMLVTVICVFIAELFQKHGIYQLALVRNGIMLRHGREIDLMQTVTVGEAMYSPAPTIEQDATLTELRDSLRYYHRNALSVVDDDGKLVGIVTLSDLQRVYSGPDTCGITVKEICTKDVVTASPDDVLWTGIRKMGAFGVGRLPVMDSRTGELVGQLNRRDIVDAYNTAIQRKMHDQQLAEQVRLNTLTGAHVYEMYVDENCDLNGRAISDVHWPPESTVASIMRRGKLIVPHGDTQIREGDTVTIVADPHSEPQLRELFGEDVAARP